MLTPAQMAPWSRVDAAPPPPHARYAVIRDGKVFTATPCYGMHAPWWVVRTMAEAYPNEAEPVAMQPADLWMPIEGVAALTTATARLAEVEASLAAQAELRARAEREWEESEATIRHMGKAFSDEKDALTRQAMGAEAALTAMIEDRNKANDRIVQLGGELGRTEAQLTAMTQERDALRRAINAYRAGIMALNPALSAALVAHLPEPQGGDSEF